MDHTIPDVGKADIADRAGREPVEGRADTVPDKVRTDHDGTAPNDASIHFPSRKRRDHADGPACKNRVRFISVLVI